MLIRTALCVLLVSCLTVTLRAGVPDDVDKETSALLEKVKSPDASLREQAVRELVGIRESVSIELRQIVADTNAGKDTSNSAAKASSLYLMGVWGLLQCKDVLEAEQNWRYGGERPDGTAALWTVISLEDDQKLGRTAETALRVARFGGGVTLAPSRQKADLSAYPVLNKALSGLRSRDNALFEQSEKELYWWYMTVSDAVEHILTLDRGRLYPDDVKVTASFLAGEYRIVTRLGLCENINLYDGRKLTAGYPCCTVADTPDTAYPCIVALIKCGRRADFEMLVRKMGDSSCSKESRERIAKALKTIDPEAAKKEFKSYYEYVQINASRVPESAQIVSSLAEVRSIIEQP